MSRKVLVVDDEKLIVKGIRFNLEQDGMEVDCAYDGEEAVEKAKANKYDIILLDLHQPNMQPINNIPKNIVYSGSKSNVAMTMIGGKILYEKGRFFLAEQPEDIYRKAGQIKERLVKEK